MSLICSFLVGLVLGVGHLAPSVLVYFAPYTTSTVPHQLTSILALVFSFWGIAYLYRQWSAAATCLRRFLLGAVSGFGYYIVSCHWFGEAFIVGDEFYSYWALSRLIGSVTLASFWWALAFGVSHVSLRALTTSNPTSKALVFATLWSIADVLVGDFALRIPLAPLSGAMLDTPVQILFTYVGQHGATLVLILTAALAGVFVRRTMYLVFLTGLLAVVLTAVSLLQPTRIVPEVTSREVAMIQTGRAGSRWTGAPDLDGMMNQLIEMSKAAYSDGAQIVILPELAVPFDMRTATSNQSVQALIDAIPEGRSMIVGYHRVEVAADDPSGYRAYNTTDMIGYRGRILATHNKTHLVPFGEYIPAAFQPLGLTAPSAPSIGYSTNKPETLIVSNVEGIPPFSFATCYEVMISGVISRETEGAEWIINLSSEIMFGRTIAPQLLYNYVRMRSIETGLPIYRATTTGYSGAIFPGGIDIGHLKLGEVGTVWAPLPPNVQPTVFRKFGYLPLYLAWPLLLLIAFGVASNRIPGRNDHVPDVARGRS